MQIAHDNHVVMECVCQLFLTFCWRTECRKQPWGSVSQRFLHLKGIIEDPQTWQVCRNHVKTDNVFQWFSMQLLIQHVRRSSTWVSGLRALNPIVAAVICRRKVGSVTRWALVEQICARTKTAHGMSLTQPGKPEKQYVLNMRNRM